MYGKKISHLNAVPRIIEKNEAVTIDFRYIFAYIDAFSLLVRHIYKC